VTGKLSYWAQALDNASPDHIQLYGEELPPDDLVRRQEVVKRVSGVIKQGVRVFDSGGVLLTADAHRFVVEIPSKQRDRAGRVAPVVCYGEYDGYVGEELETRVFAGLAEFAERIGRTLAPEYSELIYAAFVALKKKSLKTKLVHAVTIGATALGFLILVLSYLLASRGA
jgi:hypothetical protein